MGTLPKRLSRSQAGFSLVELMVAVGIVGIIAAVAIPQYSKFSARGRTSAAKADLSAMYAAQRNFHAEAPSYTGCLEDIGIDPTGMGNTRTYYSYGYDNTVAQNNCGATGTLNCYATRWSMAAATVPCAGMTGFAANAAINLGTGATTIANAHTPNASMGDTQVGKDFFFIRGAGNISDSNLGGATPFDLWYINSDKVLQNPRPGV